MTETPSVEVKVGLFDKLVKDIEAKPEGELVLEKLGEKELKGVIDDLLKSSTSIPGLTVSSDLEVDISKAKQNGSVSGIIGIDYTGLGHSEVEIDLTLGNNPNRKNTIIAENLEINQKLSSRAKAALAVKKIDLDKELRSRLKDPHTSLMMLFTDQLREKGLILTGFAALFSDKQDVLILGFKCKKD